MPAAGRLTVLTKAMKTKTSRKSKATAFTQTHPLVARLMLAVERVEAAYQAVHSSLAAFRLATRSQGAAATDE